MSTVWDIWDLLWNSRGDSCQISVVQKSLKIRSWETFSLLSKRNNWDPMCDFFSYNIMSESHVRRSSNDDLDRLPLFIITGCCLNSRRRTDLVSYGQSRADRSQNAVALVIFHPKSTLIASCRSFSKYFISSLLDINLEPQVFCNWKVFRFLLS